MSKFVTIDYNTLLPNGGLVILKLISWNVNGIRACLQKDFLASFLSLTRTFSACRNETASWPVGSSAGRLRTILELCRKKGYSRYPPFFHAADRSASPTAWGVPALDQEGRVITLEFGKFYLVTCYTPNAQDGLKRLDHRMAWGRRVPAAPFGAGPGKACHCMRRPQCGPSGN